MMSTKGPEKKSSPPDSGNGSAGVELPRSREGEGSTESAIDAQLADLREALAQKEAEAHANYDRYLRALADLDNFKKRARKEQAESQRFGGEALIRDLLPILDNLGRAVDHAADGGNGGPLVEGVSMVLKSMEDVLKRYGVSVIDAKPGEVFDPAKHEAVGRAEVDGDANRIVAQHERGYLLHDRLLRPAKVVVSCPKTPEGR